MGQYSVKEMRGIDYSHHGNTIGPALSTRAGCFNSNTAKAKKAKEWPFLNCEVGDSVKGNGGFRTYDNTSAKIESAFSQYTFETTKVSG